MLFKLLQNHDESRLSSRGMRKRGITSQNEKRDEIEGKI
jgi:hypothetical protein